jgi:hypothetical protein
LTQQPSTCPQLAGQAIVQFGHGTSDGIEYAMKFFVSRSAFETEAAVYCNSALCKLIPGLKMISSNADGSSCDGFGRPLPPCLVMEKGESLDHWSDRAKPDIFQAVGVRTTLYAFIAFTQV